MCVFLIKRFRVTGFTIEQFCTTELGKNLCFFTRLGEVEKF